MRTPLKTLFGFALLCAVPVFAAPQPSVIIGGRIVPFEAKPFVGTDGQLFAPVDAVQLLGAKYTPNTDNSVTVTSESGKSFQFSYISSQGRYCVPMEKVARALGASTDWQPRAQTLTLRARLQMVRQDANTLIISTSYPVYYSVTRIAHPQRLYVDLHGLDLSSTAASIPSASADVTRIRSGQIDPQTVRITIDLNRDLSYHVVSGIQTDRVEVALGSSGGTPLPVPVHAAALPITPAIPIETASAVSITSVTCHVISDTLTQIAVAATGPTPYRTVTLAEPSRLAFDLAGAALGNGLTLAQSITHPVIKDWRIGTLRTAHTKFGRVVVDLSKLVAYTITTEPQAGGGVTYMINLQTPGTPSVEPLHPDSSLAGKTIVIDPGHGGRDTGACDVTGTIYEKDITLAIGRRLRDALVQTGATVFMTRDSDVLPSVAARPQFANAQHADFFVSIHCDSSGSQNAHTGTTVYFHAQNSLCRTMASDLGRRISEVSGIPYNGVKSDTIRFVTGFGVLRGSIMPAVLVETGYMNNDSDLAKLREDTTQQNIAEGVIAGLRDFITDRANPAQQSASK